MKWLYVLALIVGMSFVAGASSYVHYVHYVYWDATYGWVHVYNPEYTSTPCEDFGVGTTVNWNGTFGECVNGGFHSTVEILD